QLEDMAPLVRLSAKIEKVPVPINSISGISLANLLDRMATVSHPANPTESRRPRRLSEVLGPVDQWWRLYRDPDDHVEALLANPVNPGGFYDDDESPGFQQAMIDAYRAVLDGNKFDLKTAGWAEYSALHDLVTHRVEGDFGRNALRADDQGRF